VYVKLDHGHFLPRLLNLSVTPLIRSIYDIRDYITYESEDVKVKLSLCLINQAVEHKDIRGVKI
jgi:hypothetical protein